MKKKFDKEVTVQQGTKSLQAIRKLYKEIEHAKIEPDSYYQFDEKGNFIRYDINNLLK